MEETIKQLHQFIETHGQDNGFIATVWNIVEENKGDHAVIGQLVEAVQREILKLD